MADGTQLDPGTGGDTIYTDDIAAGSAAGMKVQGVKIGTGANGTWTEVSTSNPVPVSDAGGSLTVDGTVAVSGTTAVSAASLPLPSGAATETSVAATASAAGVTTDAEATANGSIIAILKRLRTLLNGGLPAALGANGGLKIEGVASGTTVPVSDGGGSLTVDGTVAVSGTVAVTDNSGSLTVDGTGLGVVGNAAADAAVSGNPVSVAGRGSTATPTAMSADGDVTHIWTTLNGAVNVADAGGSLTVDNAGTFAVQATLQAGSAAVGKLAANDGVDIGDVTVNNAAGASAVNIQDGGNSITVDGTVAATQSGTWTVQPGNTANTTAWKVDGSAVTQPVSDAGGSLTVDNGGTFAVQDSQVVTDNAGFTDGTTKVQPAGYIFDEVAGTALTENDAAAARIDSKRAQIGVIEDATTRGQRAAVSAAGRLSVDGSGVTQPVSGTVTANLAAGTNNIGDVDVLSVPAPLSTTGGGTEATALRVTVATDSTGVLSVDDNGSTLSVDDGGGSLTVDGTVTASNTAGSVAHDAADSGNPVKVGGRARTSDITAVASDDRTDFITDALGKQITSPYSSPENLLSGATSAITDTTSTSVIAAQGAGVRTYVTSVSVMNSHATVSTVVEIRDGSGGTVLHRGYALAAGGGYVITFPAPLRLSANTALHAVCGTTGSNIYVSASGFKAAL